jgi:hypothetical protein
MPRPRRPRTVPGGRPPGRPDAGFITVQYVWVIGTSLVLFTLFANVILVQYGRGVVRTALDEGVRAGARVTASAPAAELACETAADRARQDLLGGRLGNHVSFDCTPDPATGTMRAVADATFASWFPAVPDWSFSATAVAVQERTP